LTRIFLSHSSGNNPEAVALRDWLIAEGWDDLFLDLDPSRGIAAGERWERRLYEAANRCEAVLFLVSRAWLQSEWCLREFRLAQKLNKRSFGILVEPIPVRELPAELTANWQLVDLAQGADHRIFRAVLPDGTESHITFSVSGLARLKAGLTRAGLDARFFQWPPESDPDRPPYRGMRPLEAEDAGIFFGREAPTIEALDRLRGLSEAAPPRFMVILGASGAGKSSFLRAGLLPRLQRDDQRYLPLPIIRPERAALTGESGLIRSLEAAVKVAGLRQTRAEVRAAVESGATTVTTLLVALAEKARASGGTNEGQLNPRRIVVAIDQAEELFLAEGVAEADGFLRLVGDLATDPKSNLIVIATIRSDAYERLQTAPALDGVRQETLSLPPLPRGAYQIVIEGPAARLAETRRSLKIEPALTAALLADVEQGGAKDALPLLAFTLERLFLEHGGDGDLRFSEYRDIGGIKGSIDAAVDGALRAADANPSVPKDRAAREALLRRALIPWLAGIDPETGAPRRRIARLSEIPEEARPLVAHLISARLLATDRNPDTGETTVEPAHEALLRQWGLLQGWLEEDFAVLSTLEAVKRAARDWEANARSPDWLAHTAGRLDDAEALLARDNFAGVLDPTDRAYLAAARATDTSRRNRELEEARKLAAEKEKVARRTQIAGGVVGVVAVIAVGAALFGFYQARRADQQAAFAIEQANIAEQEKARAEKNFVAAKQAVNSLIFDIAQGLRNVTGMRVESIRKVLDTVRTTVDRLAETTPDDPELGRSRYAMFAEFVDTYLAAGDVQAALDAADQSYSIARRLAEADAGNSEAQRDLSMSLVKVGDAKLQAGDRAGALDAYEESLAIRQKLVEVDPGNAATQRDVSVSLEKLGNVKLLAGDWEGALAAYEESLATDRGLADADPRNAQAQRDLSVSLNKLGDVKLQAGDSAGALAAYDESLALRRRLAETDPGNAQAQRDVAGSLERLGDVKLQIGDRAGALAAYDESLAIRRGLADSDSGNAEMHRDVLVSLVKISDTKLQAGDPAGAMIALEEGLSIARWLVEADPGNAEAQRDLSLSLNRIGDVKLQLGDRAAALAAYDESLAIHRKLAQVDPGNAEAQIGVVVSLTKMAEVSGDPGPLYQEALAILRALDAEGRLTIQQQGWITIVEDRLAALPSNEDQENAKR
jgi:tetratricopeptide (TPR) repeat protein